ncbi:hypothetical protein D1815_15455 [Aquimarina sp. AD1]|uniref:hypothetical protein n=1 Tax=Aquimarina TaxID=290174 RepID=UPI00040D9F71|nr:MULTISPECIES: hypothetical protein [Aquimarina]AXT57073.1 hypothetical protein D1815_15455 [Aquimarina sp. AD1]RKN35079.1 hypothetical protein D7035_03490 [Aquimarina sp. AD1]
MRKSFFFLIFLFVFNWMQSQSSFNKSIDATDLTEVSITLDNTFQIEVTNTSENKIIVTAVSEGEYQNNVFINTKRNENSLSIIDDIQPFSENHNDKLSAHKVIVLKVKIQLPKHLNVVITSRLASLNLNAKIKSLFVELNSGDCFLNDFIGNAVINTLDGSITIYTKNATINASTKKGILSAEKIFGEHLIELKSISGDISVYKTK